MFGAIESDVRWEQIALSVFLIAVFVRDVSENRNSPVATAPTTVSIIGCVALAANGVIQPDGLVLLVPATGCFTVGFAMHVWQRGWRASSGSTP